MGSVREPATFEWGRDGKRGRPTRTRLDPVIENSDERACTMYGIASRNEMAPRAAAISRSDSDKPAIMS